MPSWRAELVVGCITDSQLKKSVLSVWWDFKITHWELLPPNQTINAILYISQ